jgi:SAM-dependent methyltransferase
MQHPIGAASSRWREQLRAWAIPEAILAAAPESPWGFDVATFDQRASQAAARDTPTRLRALEALPAGGTVLDVGCGAGAAGLALADRAGRVVGVDESPRMLAAFSHRADGLDVEHAEIEGRWPDVADAAPHADVVVCAYVVHNVPDLAPFLDRLGRHARERVIVEMTTTHPLSWLGPYWQRFHGLDRPVGPTDDDALAVFAELGVAPEVEHWQDSPPWRDVVPFIRRRLCLAPDRDAEVAAAVAELGVPPERTVATLWWDGA